MTDERLQELADEYWELDHSLKHVPTRKVTRRHKIVHARQLEILKEVGQYRPGDDPKALIEERRPR